MLFLHSFYKCLFCAVFQANMNHKLPILLFSFFYTIRLSAQHTLPAKDTNKSTQLIIFSHDAKDVNQTYSEKNGTQNIIKTGIISFTSGHQTLYYERVLSDHASIEGGMGVTFRNHVADLGYTIGNVSILSGEDIEYLAKGDGFDDDYSNYDHRKVNVGLSLSIAPRYYFAGNAPEGQFIQADIQFKLYRYSSALADTNFNPTGTPVYTNNFFAEYRQQTDVTVDLGEQFVYDKISLEMFAGFGLRYVTEKRNNIGLNNYTSPASYFYNQSIISNTTAFDLLLEFKLGYHF